MDDEVVFRIVTGQAEPQDEARAAEWLPESPEHEVLVKEVIQILNLAAAAEDALDIGPLPTGEELVTKSRARRRSWRAGLLAVAAVLVVAVALTFTRHPAEAPLAALAAVGFNSDEFVTEVEPATVNLRDGTVIRLAPQTRLQLHERADAREVSLNGRGYFAVAPDPEAPFTIRSEAGTVTVLGTRFDLDINGRDLRLIVTEGRVRLNVRGNAVVVHAGQMAQVIDGNLAHPIDLPDPGALIDWVGNFIVFQRTPLETVVREMENRYDIRIELTIPELKDRTVTALFAGRSLEEITEIICVVAQLECAMEGNLLKMAPER